MTDPLALDAFLAPCTADVRDLALRARAVIRAAFPAAVEMLDEPARLIAYGTDRTYRGLVCGLALQRGYVNLMFARGAELPDPAGLLQGTGRRARHVKLRRAEDVEQPAVAALLAAALARHGAGQP